MPRQTRRRFLRDAALGGVGLVILSDSRSARAYPANEKVNVALVGVGGRGKWYVGVVPKQANVVALCDVDDRKTQPACQSLPKVPKYHDFRKMLEQRHKQIDGVMVATPDHTHAVITVAALKAGKHVFCEKPLTGCVGEARRVREVAAKTRLATRMGNQGSASAQFRRGVELIEDGVLGEIREAFVWCEGGGPDAKEPPKGAEPVPDYLKWDLWLGPNKDRPFNPKWLHWNTWREFGTGLNGNRGSHSGYLNFYALRIAELWKQEASARPRIKVLAESSGINRLSFPKWEVVHFQIPARGKLPPLGIHWVNGRGAPAWRQKIEERMGRRLDWGDAGQKKWKDYEGAILVGTKGRIYAKGSNSGIELLPAERFAGTDLRPQRLTQPCGMPEPEWLGAIRGEKVRLMSPFSMAGPYTEMMLLGIAGIEGSIAALGDWKEFGEMMGAFYNGHYRGRHVYKIEEPDHPVAACLRGKPLQLDDQSYLPGPPYSRQKLRVLLSLDLTKTPDPSAIDKQAWLKGHVKRQVVYTGREPDWAVSWVRQHGRGRVFYCSLGVDWRSYLDPAFLRYLLSGIQFSIGDLPGKAAPSKK